MISIRPNRFYNSYSAPNNCSLKDWAYVCHLFYPAGKPESSRSRVGKGSQQMDLSALTLELSDFCNQCVCITGTQEVSGLILSFTQTFT